MTHLPRLPELLDDLRGGHSFFQVDNYILARAGGTPYGMYKQALRELHTREQGRAQALLALAKLARRERWAFWRSRIERAHDALQRESLERQIRDVEREERRFYEHAVRLKDALGELSPERVEALEAEHWKHKLKAQAAIDLLVHENLQAGTIELLLSLRTSERAEFLEILSSGAAKQKLLAWLSTYVPEHDIERTSALPEGGRHALHALAGS